MSVVAKRMDQDATWYTKVGLGPGDTVLDADAAPRPPKRGTAVPQFSAHVCCGQIAGWIKMPLGTEVDLGPGLFVLDGDSAPNFRSMSVVVERLDGSRYHLVRRWASAQTTLC